MGQTNDNEDPELILEKLKALTINDEDNTSLDSSFQTIRKILSDYKLYKDIVSKNDKNEKNNKDKRRKSAFLINNFNFGTNIEYSKNDLLNFKGKYDKNVIQEANHKLERIKKWVIMTKSSYLNDDENEKSFQSIEKKKININKNNSNSSNNIRKFKKFDSKNSKNSHKTIIISNYTDKKIENGITQFYINQNDKFIERIKKGPPDCFRWTSWCIINNLPLDRDNHVYENYINMHLEKENKDRIIRDIQRTFSERNIESKELRKMETSLYNVLKAFWNLDKEIGYCQGMNLLVGFLLIVSDFNERDTFYLLISKFSQTFKLQRNLEFNFRGLFSEEFPLLYFLNYIFDSQLELHSRNLKEHLNEMGMTIDLWMGKWFQTLFTIILPINWCQRLWDNIFAENIFFIVKFGIAFTLIIKDDLMNMKEEFEILNYFKNFEKYSLSEKNDLLNEKCDIEALILKCKKIKIDVGIYLKNYEKSRENGKGFLYKMEKIEDVQYKLNNEIIKKPTIRTELFPDEKRSKGSNSESNNISKISKENSNKDNKDVSEEEIFLEKNTKEIDNIINIRKNNRVKNLQINKMKKNFNLKNRLKSVDFSALNQIPMTDRYLSNKLNIDKFKNEVLNKNKKNGNNENDGSSNYIQSDKNVFSNKNINYLKTDINNDYDSNNKRIKTEISNNETIKKSQNSNRNNDNSLSILEDSINNTYYQNTEENLYNAEKNNVINNNIETHRFGNILKENKFDYLTYKNKFDKSNTKNGESYFSPSFKRKKEYFLGLHIDQKSGLTSFAQKNNFDMKGIKTMNSSNYTNANKFVKNLGIIFDKEKGNH